MYSHPFNQEVDFSRTDVSDVIQCNGFTEEANLIVARGRIPQCLVDILRGSWLFVNCNKQ